MTNPMFSPQPNYSGVTIQIANPAVNVGQGRQVSDYCSYNPYVSNPQVQNLANVPYADYLQAPVQNPIPANNMIPLNTSNQPQMQSLPSYPPQYYLNNYNLQTPANEESIDKIAKNLEKLNNNQQIPQNNGSQNITPQEKGVVDSSDIKQKEYPINEPKEEDMSKSQGIIDDLDARDAAIKAEKENTKEQRVVALTDEYIKSLENYLNNPNEEIRLMASKDILTRLDEDKSRYDDAALNALLNKMMQDPSKLIRVAALSAFSSQLASGNEYTVELLHSIQANPSADKEDVLQAADILLKMSAGTEVKNIPNPSVKEEQAKEQK